MPTSTKFAGVNDPRVIITIVVLTGARQERLRDCLTGLEYLDSPNSNDRRHNTKTPKLILVQYWTSITNMLGKTSMGSLTAAVIAVVLGLSAAMNNSLFAHAAITSSLQVEFYATSCPAAESLIQNATQAKWNVDRTITAGLLRISFHDCFVQVIAADCQHSCVN